MRADRLSKMLLWKRVEDARAQWINAHNLVKQVTQDNTSDAIHAVDGNYAYSRALRVEALAVKDYLDALQRFRGAVSVNHASNGITEDEAPTKAGGRHLANGGITPREREVLRLIASGKSSKQVAEHLGIAFKTVVCHRYRVQTKLNAHNTADLTRAALRMGLIEL